MALSRRTGARFQASIWPGFVDAMTGLLLVLMFVLTIFMVIQFVLRETITGQENQLTELSAEVAALAGALGLEQDRSAALGAQVGNLSSTLADTETALSAAEALAAEQSALIDRLTVERDTLTANLSDAENRITGFEAQVAGLLAQQRNAEAQIAGLESREAELLDAQEALNLALAQARDEIDEGTEAARLAAARREALEALIAQMETEGATAQQQIAALEAERDAAQVAITDLEAAQLADAAAAQALRDRLAEADTELTAMTLALEEQRQQAEDTLTLLAAARAAQEDLDENLAIALLAQQEAERAAAALGVEREALAQELAAALEEQGQQAASAEDLQTQLAQALIARTTLEQSLADSQAARDAQAALLSDTEAERDALAAEIASATEQGGALSAQLADVDGQRAILAEQLADAVAALAAAQQTAGQSQTEAERRAALLAEANAALSEEQALSAESQRQVALLNEQVATLRAELGRLQALLDLAGDADAEANVQIESLTQDLNTAMARALLAERRARALEEAEAARLAAEAEELERFRSDFLGRMRDVLEGVEGVRIEGDRFVFSSEVLFEPGAAELSGEGRLEIAKVAGILRGVADDIPDEIDWVIRVDGHTDNVPLSGLGQFANNWELSQARALSVVLYMVNFLGIPPERMAANGFGQYQPINPADTPEARAQNRRIELKLTER